MLLKKLSYVCAVTLVIVSLAGCGTKENSTGTDTASTQTQEDVSTSTDAPEEDETEDEASVSESSNKKETTNKKKTTKKKTKKKSTGLRADFKKAMDSYEDFRDEYCSFMKSYQEDPSDASLLEDYTSYMSKYSDMVKKFDKWESKDLNEKEMEYYIDVQARVTKKLAKVSAK